MGTYVFDSRIVSADVPKTVVMGGGGDGTLLIDFGILMRTVTPGAGTLLTTVEYTDATGTANQLNVAMALTAGNLAMQPFPVLWWNLFYDLTIQYTYLAPGGTCQVDIPLRL